MTCVAIDTQQHEPVRILALRLHQRRHLARVHRVDATIALGRREQHRRVAHSGAHVVIRRVAAEPSDLIRALGRAVFGDPEPRDAEILVAQHVQQRNGARDRGEEVGPLRERHTDEQSAVRPAGDRESLRPRPAALDERLGGRVEIVEDVLLVPEHPGAVPSLAVLATAAQIRQRVEAACLDPRRRSRGVQRCARHVEATVAGQERGHVAGRHDVAPAYQEHRDRGAVA